MGNVTDVVFYLMYTAAQSKNFTFKCHREQTDIYAVNDIKFHPTHGTFVTAGADGVFNFWDKDSKQRLKQMGKCNAPIPCGEFSLIIVWEIRLMFFKFTLQGRLARTAASTRTLCHTTGARVGRIPWRRRGRITSSFTGCRRAR
jgi:WD40 repeat protein